jgi:hypothetical protein
MRRSFRRDLLVTVAPSAPPRKPRKERKKKNPSQRCLPLMRLFKSFVDLMIVDYDCQILASEVGVRVASARRWSYGYPPHKDLLWPIARYFATRMQDSEKRVHNQIVQTLDDWRKI